MGKKRVPFHFTKANATGTLAALDWLLGEIVEGPGGADLEFVRDHVAETLVVDNTNVDISLEFLAGDAAVHWLVAMVIVASLAELLTEEGGGGVLFVELEGRGVLGEAVEGAGFGRHALDEHADGHAGGKGVGVDDNVGTHAALGEGQIDEGILLAHDTLLSVAGAELVADDGVAGHPVLDVHTMQGRL